jgi:hypothetical protein
MAGAGGDEVDRTVLRKAPRYKSCELLRERTLTEDAIGSLNHFAERATREAAKNGPKVARNHRSGHALAGCIAK